MKYTKAILLSCLMLCAALFTGCSDDDNGNDLPIGQGEVTFKFARNKVYTISTLEDMARLKVTLEKDGKTIVLSGIDLSGNEDELTSSVSRLDEGTYKVVKYVAYNNKGAQVMEAYVEEENTFTVTHGEMATYYFPVEIRIIIVNNQLRNMLFGLCTEVLGNDSTKWPKTWRMENEDLLTWENLEFVIDDYGNITYLASITFDNKTFPGMKKLPNTIANFITIENFRIMDIPEFEELPDNLDQSAASGILIQNTGLKEFPKNFEKMKNLRSLTIVNSKLKEIPARLGDLESIRDVEISGNEISEFPVEVAKKWQKVVALRMNDTKLSSLPTEVFNMRKVNTFDFRDNKNLSSLPESSNETYMGGLFLDGCAFTSIPKIAQTKRMRTLTLANNKITSVTKEELNKLSTDLLTLNLDGNQINSFPKMESESLSELSLNNCGLQAIPDLSRLPALNVFSASHNQITEVAENTFKENEKLAILNLSDNSSLRTFSNDAGFTLKEQTIEYKNDNDTQTQTALKPYYLNCVNVDNCPNLTWTVPATWCCIKNFYVWNKEEMPLPVRNVIVYKRGSNGVTRDVCPVCNRPNVESDYKYPKTFDEIMEDLKKNQNK